MGVAGWAVKRVLTDACPRQSSKAATPENPMTAPSRRDVFANLVSKYHNSFAGVAGGVVEHSPEFISRVIEGAGDNPTLAAATLRLDPRLTSTDHGAVAYAVAKAVTENKQLAPAFIDMELVEKTLMVYFDAQAPADKAEKCLAEVGRVGVVARPGDRISDSVVSDVFIMAVAPAEKMVESVVTEMKKKFPPFMKKDKGCDDKKKDSDKSDDADEATAGAPLYRPIAECAHYGLAEDVFGDESLAHCVAEADGVKAVFRGLFGEKALASTLSAAIGESGAPLADDAAGQRNRILRVLAGRGYLPHGAEAVTWPAPVAEAIAKVVDAAAAVADKWALVEGKGRTAADAEVFARAVDEVAVALDTVMADANDVFEAFVDRIANLGIDPLADEKRAELVGRVREAATKNEAVVIAKCLASLARAALFERGMYADAAQRDVVAAWTAYVAEATKPAPLPVTSADAIVADLLA